MYLYTQKMIKKILLLFTLLFSSNIIAQLSETQINQKIEESRKQGTKEWELKKLYTLLHNQRIQQPSFPSQSQAGCTNIGFDNGTTSGWTLLSGDINLINLPCNTCPTSTGAIDWVITPGSTAGSCGCTTSQCVAGIDGYGNFSTTSPLSGDVLLLNNACAGGKIQKAAQTFMVSPANVSFTFAYAVVLQDGGHPANQQPYFYVNVLDSNNNAIPCTKYEATPSVGTGVSGWQTSACDNTVSYKTWTVVTLNLSTYIGSSVTIEFIVSDCSQGGHFGYAYIDASCNPNQITLTKPLCPGQNAILSGPAGLATYSWTGPVTGNGQSLTTGIPGNYTLTTTSATGCPSPLLYYNLISLPSPTVTVNSPTICVSNQAVLTASGASTYTWNTNSSLNPLNVSPQTTTNYTVIGTDVNGCTDTATSTVTVNSLPITISYNAPLCVNQNLQLTSSGGNIYSWTGPSNFISNQQNPTINGVLAANSGIYNLSVTSGTCQHDTTINVIVNPLPIITASGSTVCVGSPIQLTSSGGNIYSWNGPNLFLSNQQNPSIANAQTIMSGNYFVISIGVNGCSNAAVAQVVVNSPIQVVASNNTPICQGSTINLSSSQPATIWSGPNTFSSNQQNPIITNSQITMSGIYTAIATDINGCQSANTTNVIINTLPTAVATNNTPICQGSTIDLFGSGGVNYMWSGPNTSNQQNPIILNAQLNYGGTYTLNITDANGCKDSTTTLVVINTSPIVTVNSATVCVGNIINLSASGATSYTWSPISTLAVNGANAVSNTNISTTYSVIGSNVNGCKDSATSNVIVNPLPVVSVNSDTICLNKQVILTANGGIIYTWLPSNGLSPNTNNSVIASPSLNTSYTVTVVDTNGCINTAISNVIVNIPATVSITPLNSYGCAPLCVNFVTSYLTNSICDWNFGNSTLDGYCNPTKCFNTAGSFNIVVTVTDTNGCIVTANAFVTVYPTPIANYNIIPQPTTIIDPNIIFTDGSNGAIINSWNWSFGDGNNDTSNVQNPTHEYNDVGNYQSQLVVISNHGCIDTARQTVIIGNDYTLYVPNSFSPNGDNKDDIFLAVGEGITGFKMYIYDRWGLLIFYSEDINRGWDGRYLAKGNAIVQEDVYVWLIEAKIFNNKVKNLSGTVTLIK